MLTINKFKFTEVSTAGKSDPVLSNQDYIVCTAGILMLFDSYKCNLSALLLLTYCSQDTPHSYIPMLEEFMVTAHLPLMLLLVLLKMNEMKYSCLKLSEETVQGRSES